MNARDTIINEYKSQQTNKSIFVPTDFDSSNATFDSYSLNEIMEQIDVDHIKSLIHQLPVSHKEVFNLYVIDGYNHKEIAELMDIPSGTSKWLLAEARKKLKVMVTNSLNINKAIAIWVEVTRFEPIVNLLKQTEKETNQSCVNLFLLSNNSSSDLF